MGMWFVILVKPGCEAQALGLLKATPKADALEELFCPMSEYLRRSQGNLDETLQPMFEGCVFAVAPSKWELRACMRQAEGLAVMLEGKGQFIALEEGEEGFINAWTPLPERIAPISEAEVAKGGFATVTAGPLLGHEDQIQRWGTGHRWAFLETKIAGELTRARLGVRVTKDDSLHPWER